MKKKTCERNVLTFEFWH